MKQRGEDCAAQHDVDGGARVGRTDALPVTGGSLLVVRRDVGGLIDAGEKACAEKGCEVRRGSQSELKFELR